MLSGLELLELSFAPSFRLTGPVRSINNESEVRKEVIAGDWSVFQIKTAEGVRMDGVTEGDNVGKVGKSLRSAYIKNKWEKRKPVKGTPKSKQLGTKTGPAGEDGFMKEVTVSDAGEEDPHEDGEARLQC